MCEVLEETVRGLEGRLVLEETEKLAAYERETQLVSKVTKYNFIYIISWTVVFIHCVKTQNWSNDKIQIHLTRQKHIPF